MANFLACATSDAISLSRSPPIRARFSSCRAVPQVPTNVPVTLDGYKKAVEDQLGPIWYRLVGEKEANLAAIGTVKLIFEIPVAGGRVRNVQVTSNTGGKGDERIALDAVKQLRAPPIPAALLQAQLADHISFDESFTIFENPSPSPKTR